jgi:hypothetical protein
MRASIEVELDDALAESVTFARWPVVPLQWLGGKLVTEPTPPGIKEWAILDTKRPGLSLRVTPKSVSWAVRRKRPKGSETWRKTLGEPPGMKVKVARTLADAWFAYIITNKRNPDHDTRKEAREDTAARHARKYQFGECYLDFIKHGEERVELKDLSAKTILDYRAVVNWLKDQPIWTVPVAVLSPDHAGTLFAQWFVDADNARIVKEKNVLLAKEKHLPLPVVEHTLPLDLAAVHKALAHSRAAWNVTKGRKQATNPFSAWTKGRKLPPVPRRKTMLKTDQASGQAWLKELVAQRDSTDPLLSVLADYVLMTTLWGGRKTETAALRWMDARFDEMAARFVAETRKNKLEHWVPLTPWSHQILTERKAKSEKLGWPTGPLDPVFYSPDTKENLIADYRPLTRLLQTQTGVWIRLHDLRRTLASSVFGSVKDLGTVAIALGHKSGMEVTADYVPREEALAALRDIYVSREKKLRVLIGLDQAPSTDQLSLVQQARVEDIQALLKKANLTDLSAEQLGTLLLSANT